jgi:hypothetical protein
MTPLLCYSRSYTSNKSPLTRLLQFEFLSAKILQHSRSIICLAGPQQCIFLVCKLSHKSGEDNHDHPSSKSCHCCIWSCHCKLSYHIFIEEKPNPIWVAYVIPNSCNIFQNYSMHDSLLLSPDAVLFINFNQITPQPSKCHPVSVEFLSTRILQHSCSIICLTGP